MKKKLNLEKLNVNSFKTSYQEAIRGGNDTDLQQTCTEGYQCPGYTNNYWCWGSDNSAGAFCTAPK
ncbi:MAG: hypothetical protein WBB45_02440 [Cyclobacteriaceae bacterium]